jgi:hypothetical protein
MTPCSWWCPADIDALNRKITQLEQQVTDLQPQLEERDGELAAVRRREHCRPAR